MKVFNSLTQKLEEFRPISDKKVTIYVCGITPYDTTHLGHAYTYIFFDTLIRYLKFTGYQVIYTQNVTDINDRDTDLLERAKVQNVPWQKLADFWTKKFLKDMHALNWTVPNHYTKATRHIHHMIDLIKELLTKNLAYQINGSVYLDTAKFPDYGKLSRFEEDKMLKVSLDFEEDLKCPEKRHPLDITLWRAATASQEPHIPAFHSPFGRGRPGWHIECSAMSMEYLGEQIDIHGGGVDLIFPHHEAEIAQSEGATGKVPFAKYWIHTGNISFKGEKMSKSKGNLVMISDLIKKYSPNTVRWLLLSHHFRTSWEFREEDLNKAQKNVDTIEQTILSPVIPSASEESPAYMEFSSIMDENLNTPKALQLLVTMAKQKANGLKNLYVTLGFKI